MADLQIARSLAERIRFIEDQPSEGIKNTTPYRALHKDHMLRHGLLVDSAVTPKVEQWLLSICERLKIPRECFSAFIFSSSEIQADCVLDDNTCVLRFSSSLINLMDEAEFQFTAGHELGHFLLNHNPQDQTSKVSAESFMNQRARELSADRIGYFACANLNASIRAIMKAASGLNGHHIRFDIAQFINQAASLSCHSLGEANNSSHPSLLFRSRALLWFEMEFPAEQETLTSYQGSLDQVDNKVLKDLEELVDGQVRNLKKEIEMDIVIWKLCVLVISDGVFTKYKQEIIQNKFGSECLKSIKGFLALYPPNELLQQAQSRLNTSLADLYNEFPSTASQVEDKAFKQAYTLFQNE
jgi:hypothetical protein